VLISRHASVLGDFGRGRELPGKCLRSVKYAAQLRLGTLPLPGLLSGYRANEVANRQDADPIHFVSSVFLPCAGQCQASGKAKPSERGLCRFCKTPCASAVC